MTAPTREHILAAAAHLYGEHGFRGTTTRRIAKEAGVNEVTLFRLFGSKTDLLLEAMRTHGAVPPTAPLPEVPRDPARELAEWITQKRRAMGVMRGLIRKSMSEFEENPEMPKCMSHGARETHDAILGYFGRLAAAGHIAADADIKAATTMLLSTVFQDAIGREMMPHLFPLPSASAPAAYAKLCLRSLGYVEAATGKRRRHGRVRTLLAGALLLAVLTPGALRAQRPDSTSVSLADALHMAERVSHPVRTAEAGVLRTRGQEAQARSQYLPQLSGSAAYQRTIQSQFQAISKLSGPDTSNGANSLINSPIAEIFAAPNTVILGVSATQNLFTAGRVVAATKGAEAARTSAEIGLDAARAQLALDVAQAYFDAVASDQLVQIADSTLAQTERTLQQTSVSRQVGSSAEFDLLRSRVARDNQRPAVIQARGTRDLAYLRLRQLLGVPLGRPLTLTTPIRDDSVVAADTMRLAPGQPLAIAGTDKSIVPDTSVGQRSTVRQAEANVTAQEYALRAAKWERLPSVQLSSNYQRFAYPPDGTFLPNSFGLYFPNWTVTFGLSFPIFTGGKIGGDRMVAEANLTEARQSLEQTRELAALDAGTALNQLEQARAAYAASVGTGEQAARAYAIAEVRFREGISTQVELLQSRTDYAQARLNRVLAARDVEVARLRVALLKDLPVGTSTGTAQSTAAPSTGRPQ
jgi:outer membrane protein